MVYKLRITEHADALLDELVNHLNFTLKNQQAAKHLLDNIEKIYNRLEENPEQFPLIKDKYLADKGYRNAVIPDMNYIIVFLINKDVVEVVGIFHQLENYQRKLL